MEVQGIHRAAFRQEATRGTSADVDKGTAYRVVRQRVLRVLSIEQVEVR